MGNGTLKMNFVETGCRGERQASGSSMGYDLLTYLSKLDSLHSTRLHTSAHF